MSLVTMQIEVDDTLIDKVIHKFRRHGARDAVDLALRSVLTGSGGVDSSLQDREFDEFGDPGALDPHRRRDTA